MACCCKVDPDAQRIDAIADGVITEMQDTEQGGENTNVVIELEIEGGKSVATLVPEGKLEDAEKPLDAEKTAVAEKPVLAENLAQDSVVAEKPVPAENLVQDSVVAEKNVEAEAPADVEKGVAAEQIGGNVNTSDKPFGPGIDVKRKRPITWEIIFFVFFVIAFTAQFALSIAIYASKNSEMKAADEDCPSGMKDVNRCALGVPWHEQKNQFLFTLGRCVSADICTEVVECVRSESPNQRPRFLSEGGSFRAYLRSLVSERGDEHLAFKRAGRRQLLGQKMDVPESVWDFLERFAYQPAVLFSAVFIAAAAWLFFLQKCTMAAVWGIIVMDVLMLIAVFIWYLVDFEVVNWACLVLAIAVIIAAAVLYKKINCAVQIMKTAMDGLASNKRVFIVCFGIQLLWVAYFAMWVSAVVTIHFIVEVGHSEMGQCELHTQGWASSSGMYIFWGLMYYWVTYFCRNTNLILITANLSGWYFNEADYKSNWVVASRWCVGPLAGGNAFCSGIMGLCHYLLARSSSLFKIIFSVLNPIDWIPLCLSLCLKTIILTYTKYGLIAHAFSGKPFFQAAPRAFQLLKWKLGDALLTDYLGARVMSWATYVISIGIAFAAWAWADDVQGVETFGAMDATLLIIVIILYAYCLSMPFVSLILVILLEQVLPAEMDVGLRARMNSIFASVFIGSISFFILTFVSQIVVNAMDVIFFCFAVEADNSGDKNEQERFQKLYASINDSIKPGVAPSGPVVSKPIPQEMSVTVPPGTTPGQMLQIQTPQGVTVQVAIPAGVQPGQSFTVQV